MTNMKLFNRLSVLIVSIIFFTGCQMGLVYDEGIPVDIYEEVGLGTPYWNVYGRELFKNQIYAKGSWNKWVEGYIATQNIGNGTTAKEFTNTANEDVVINDTLTLAPGETVILKNSLTREYLASAPGDSLYVINTFIESSCLYKSPGAVYFFDSQKFTPPFQLSGVLEDGNLLGTEITLPIKPKEIIFEFLLAQPHNCIVENVDGAPALGKPGDFTKPRRYMVVNKSRRPDKKEAKKRLYEIRVTFLPSSIVP